ncbi:MAG: response regulator transcription factor [Aphanocapsa sp. GSE-SYN-MK-11-07L]|jgi:DNA-binding response OmpR family regulator|nr:response regulator transcription factor [Aphanocapsa sp. GSE-SYN-MK-11-07L]
MNRILIAEDEPRIAAFVEKGLQAHGFAVSVATDSQQTLLIVEASTFDLLILDLGLPGQDGLQVLTQLRGEGETLPIIILSARDDIRDKVAGFERGADDYVTKPFRFEELLIRIKARLRNRNSANRQIEAILQNGNLLLDLRTRKVKVDGCWMELPCREFNLAETFFRHPGQVLSREQLLDRVWGYAYDPGSNIVDVYVSYLRKKLGNNLIETVRGMGYRFKT